VGQPLAKAAIDLACYDLWGKSAGRSVAELLGGVRAPEVRLSWTVQSPTLAGAEQLLAQGRELGYSSYNVKIGYPQTPQYDRELVRLVRGFAPEGFHWADANTSYDLDTALAMAPALAEAGFKALESPFPPNRFRDYQRLRRLGALPILMDEGIVSPVETAEFIALGMMDGIAMKVARCGGLWHASRIVTQLADAGLALFASGLSDPEWSLAASIHLFAAAGSRAPCGAQQAAVHCRPRTLDPEFRACGTASGCRAAGARVRRTSCGGGVDVVAGIGTTDGHHDGRRDADRDRGAVAACWPRSSRLSSASCVPRRLAGGGRDLKAPRTLPRRPRFPTFFTSCRGSCTTAGSRPTRCCSGTGSP
jgi:hypothetical protein